MTSCADVGGSTGVSQGLTQSGARAGTRRTRTFAQDQGPVDRSDWLDADERSLVGARGVGPTEPTSSTRRAQASARLRTRSNSRRRRLLGRPSPRTSMITGPVLATTGGLWSTKQVVATAAPTRDSIGRMTSTMRLRSAISASTRSPARTFVDGFAGDPFTRTWPPSHNRVASGRVFTRRTAHSQRSIRVSSVVRGSVTRC